MRVHQQVHHPDRALPAPVPVLQRCGPVPCSPGECAHDDEHVVRRDAVGVGPQLAPPIVQEVLNSPGQPLDTTVRDTMGTRFGFDFSRVRIHADRRAAASARSVAARAYTVGRDIFFTLDSTGLTRSRAGDCWHMSSRM